MHFMALLQTLVVFSLPYSVQGFGRFPLWKVLTDRIRPTAPALDRDDPLTHEFNTKFCVNCRHFRSSDMKSSGAEYGRCLRNPRPLDPKMFQSQIQVTGVAPIVVPVYQYCTITRMDETKCGPDAEWFEPKD
jgi:hypothetical protein